MKKTLCLLLLAFAYTVHAQDLSNYQTHELYPYLLRSKQILDRLNTNIQADSVSADAYIKMDAEAERNEHQFLSTCLRDELQIIDKNTVMTWQRYNVVDYGADPTGTNDSKQAFINAIAAAKSHGSGAEIYIPGGTYIFSESCKLYGLYDSKITADNAAFIFTNVSAGLDVRQCRNVEITGVSIDYKLLPWTQGTLAGIVGNDVYVKFDNGYQELQNWHNASLRFYNPTSRLLIHSAYRWKYDKVNAQKQADGSWRLPALNAIDGRMPLNTIPIGSKVVILSRKGEDAYDYGMQFPSEWTFNGINLIGCEYVTFRNVNVFAAWEADVCAHGTNSGIRYINLHVEPKPGTDRLVCGNSDTHVHYTGRKGDFIYNSKISGGSDDGCDYASLMSNILSWPTDYSFLIGGALDINWTPLRSGDGVWIINPNGGPFRFFAKVFKVENASGQTLITLDRSVPLDIRNLSGNMSLGVNSKFDGMVILNTEFSNGSANGIYLYASNVAVENNTINHFFYWASLFRMSTPPFWNAGGATRNLFYNNNTVSSEFLLSTDNAAGAPSPTQCPFRHLQITNNRFTGANPLRLNYVSNSLITNNTYSIPGSVQVSINNSCGDVTQQLAPVATQSSIDFGGVPSRAIDGNTSGVYGDNSVTHTLTEANPWWMLDRQTSQFITQLKIYNRTDAGSTNRLHDFYVFVSDAPFASADPTTTVNTGGVSSYYFPGIAGVTTVFDINTSGRYVRIQIPGSMEVLSLAEVVFTSGEATSTKVYTGNWNFAASPQGWNLTHALTGFVQNAAYNLTVTTDDPYMHSPYLLNLSAGTYNYLTVRLKNSTASTTGELFWITDGDQNYEGLHKHVLIPLNPNDGGYTDYLVDLSNVPDWNGTIRQIRLDPSNAATGTVSINYVGLSTKKILTGTAGIENMEVSFYPNPVQDELNVSLKNGENLVAVDLVDIKGVSIYKKTAINNSALHLKLDESIPSGIYYLSVSAQKQTAKYKITITR